MRNVLNLCLIELCNKSIFVIAIPSSVKMCVAYITSRLKVSKFNLGSIMTIILRLKNIKENINAKDPKTSGSVIELPTNIKDKTFQTQRTQIPLVVLTQWAGSYEK